MIRLAKAGAYKLSIYLKDKVDAGVFEKYHRVITSDADPSDIKKLESTKGLKLDTAEDYRFGQIVTRFSQCPIGLTLTELAALRYLHPETEDIFDMIASGAKDGVTIEIATKVTGLEGELCEYADEILEAYDLVTLLLDFREKTSDLAREVFRWDYRLVSYMKGTDFPDLALFRDAEFYYLEENVPKLYGYEKQFEEFFKKIYGVYQKLEKEVQPYTDSISIVVSGEEETGRFTVAKRLAADAGLNIFSISFKFLTGFEDPYQILCKFARECLLTDAIPCIRDIEKLTDNKIVLNKVREICNTFGSRPLILLCRPEVKPVPLVEGRVFTFEIPRLDVSMRMDAYTGFARELGLCHDVDMKPILGKMNLTTGQLLRLVRQMKNAVDTGETLDEYKICRYCYQVLDDGRYDSIKRVQPGFKLTDLKISEKNMDILRDIVGQVNGRGKVFDEWNMGSKYAYGRCVSVILSGPPGTGKTMAVHALASELGLELFKVDLSQIADKYIGETEKRLEEVFDKAEKSNMILFFDEADSVMGKRSETKDSNDKNANNEIAFILQRMEEYDGIVILATNYMQNIDTAFMRRIRYVVNVGLPEEETRKEIWMNAFAPEVPLSNDIDFDYLASQFEIAGGNIKNIVLNATFYAANENTSVSMEHIMKAIYRENTKTSKGVDVFDYGNYAYLLKDM